MKEIQLTQGKVAIVDDEDFEYLSRFKWYAWRDPSSGVFYALRNVPLPNGKQGGERMHRRILNAGPSDEVDHRSGDGLDNRRENLRFCSDSQNAANRKLEKRNTTGFKGAYWVKVRKCWVSAIKVEGRISYLGTFPSAKEAASAYDEAAREAFGQFARTNAALGLL